MYGNSYKKINSVAESIRQGSYKLPNSGENDSLVKRPTQPEENQMEDIFEDRMADFFNYIRDDNRELAKEYSSELSSMPGGFADRLVISESSGKSEAFRTNKDGRSYAGRMQFGDARLKDWSKATGNKPITAKQFASMSAEDQMAIEKWHLADLRKNIISSGLLNEGWDLDGLMAVAHLGGTTGMKKFAKGNYNPSDELGTSLQDYYDKFKRN